MKTLLPTLLLFPLLSFSQEVVNDTKDLSRKEKKNIKESTISMCGCIEEQVNSLHPKTLEVLLLIAEKGEAAASAELESMVEGMEPEEMENFLGSFAKLESEEFSEQLDNCNRILDLSQDIQDQINDRQGPANDYFMSILNAEDACMFTNYVYSQGISEE